MGYFTTDKDGKITLPGRRERFHIWMSGFLNRFKLSKPRRM